MGSKYSTVTVSGYNSSPPPDDGSQTASNQVKWTTIKTKLPDPLKTAIESVNSNLVTFSDFGTRVITANDTPTAADHMKTIEIGPTTSAAVTVSLGDAATMAAGFVITVKNASSNVQTISRATGGDTINGVAQDLTLPRQCSITFKVNNGADGYNAEKAFGDVIYDYLDATKAARFDLSGVPTGTTVTVPVTSSGGAVPSGVIMDYAGATVPTGWLECDGTEYSATAYPTLFTAIGSAWGGGAGTFKVPDFRGRSKIGAGTGTWSEVVDSASIQTVSNGLAVTANDVKWITGMVVTYTAASAAGGLSSSSQYYVIRSSSTLIKLATTLALAQAGTEIDITTPGSGSHTLTVTLTARTLGETGGEEDHAMSSTELLAHTHSEEGVSNESDGTNAGGGVNWISAANTSGSTGGNAAMNVMNPFGVVKSIIKT